MSDTGRRIVLTQGNRISIQEFPVPRLEKSQVLIKTISSLVSAGTELGIRKLFEAGRTYGEHVIGVPKWVNEISSLSEKEIGYSNIGQIVGIGADLQDDSTFAFRLGDVVLSSGTHSSHVRVAPESQDLVAVPSGVSAEEATFGVLGSVSIYGIEIANIRLGDHVAVFGMGIVGQLALQLARLCGCETLTAVDLEPARLDIAVESGATHALNPERHNIARELGAITKSKGTDVVIEASGQSAALTTAIEVARPGAKIILLGSPWQGQSTLDFFLVHLKDLKIIGCHQPHCPTVATAFFPWTQTHNRMQVLSMIGDGRLNVKRLITQQLPYTRAEEAYRLLSNEKDKALGIILRWQTDEVRESGGS